MKVIDRTSRMFAGEELLLMLSSEWYCSITDKTDKKKKKRKGLRWTTQIASSGRKEPSGSPPSFRRSHYCSRERARRSHSAAELFPLELNLQALSFSIAHALFNFSVLPPCVFVGSRPLLCFLPQSKNMRAR